MERALSCLEYIATAHPPPMVREVAAALNLNLTTTYHLVNTLKARGYVESQAGQTLRLGPGAAVLYRSLVGDLEQGRELYHVLERLSVDTEETVYLGTLIDHRVVIESLIEGSKALRVGGLQIGYSGNEHSRAAGKVVLANLPGPELDSHLKFFAEEIAPERLPLLLQELDQIRSTGYAVDDEGYQPGVCCVAAPYFRADEHVAGSIAVSAPADRYRNERDRLTELVNAAGRRLSSLLGAGAVK